MPAEYYLEQIGKHIDEYVAGEISHIRCLTRIAQEWGQWNNARKSALNKTK